MMSSGLDITKRIIAARSPTDTRNTHSSTATHLSGRAPATPQLLPANLLEIGFLIMVLFAVAVFSALLFNANKDQRISQLQIQLAGQQTLLAHQAVLKNDLATLAAAHQQIERERDQLRSQLTQHDTLSATEIVATPTTTIPATLHGVDFTALDRELAQITRHDSHLPTALVTPELTQNIVARAHFFNTAADEKSNQSASKSIEILSEPFNK